MKKSIFIIFALIGIIFFSGCTSPTGKATGYSSCDSCCPAGEKSNIKEITKYQCADGSVVDDINLCSSHQCPACPEDTTSYAKCDGCCPPCEKETVKEESVIETVRINLGQEIQQDDLILVFTDMRIGYEEIREPLIYDEPDPNYKYVIINLTIKNNGIKETRSPTMYNEMLLVDKGYLYEPYKKWEFLTSGEEFERLFLRPEEQKTTYAVFEILDNTIPTKLFVNMTKAEVVKNVILNLEAN